MILPRASTHLNPALNRIDLLCFRVFQLCTVLPSSIAFLNTCDRKNTYFRILLLPNHCTVAFLTSLCSALYGGCKRDTARICCCVPCCYGAVAAVQQSIDISCPPGPRQQTRRTLLQRSIAGTDRDADRRTDTIPLHRPCLMRAVSINTSRHASVTAKYLAYNA